eukprot:TRINITY_DN41_c0_g1_i7.p2 TRINITY_DN41_c0_g1~~TRINITY_DN41_c0_g1_i7.p2  ORF type:complete len:220 (-),score=41.36 TRINITY_DN41_c0_g1_i7:433-1092(-)
MAEVNSVFYTIEGDRLKLLTKIAFDFNGNGDQTAQAFSEAIGSVSLENNEVQAVAQSGAQALTKDGVPMAEVLATAVIQTADGGLVEATAVAFAELATSESGVLFVEAVARAVSDLGDGCVAIAEAVSRARIQNATVLEVEARSSVRIECVALTLVACDADIRLCVGQAGRCCNDNMTPGEACDVRGARTFTYAGYCESAPEQLQIVANVGSPCYCLVE